MGKQQKTVEEVSSGEASGVHSIAEHLEDLGIEYELVSANHANHLYEVSKVKRIPLGNILRTVVLTDGLEEFLITLPANRVLDYPMLCRLLNRDLEYCDPKQTKAALFYDEQLGSILSVPGILEMSGILDNSIQDFH